MNMRRTILAIAVLSIGLASCGGETDYTGEGGEIDGELIYADKCMLCHGEDGAAGNDGASDLSKSLLNEEEMQDAVQHGRGDMVAVSELNDEEVKAVIEYVRSELKKKGQ